MIYHLILLHEQQRITHTPKQINMVETADLSSESIDDVTKINNLSTSIDDLKLKIQNERKEHQEELKEVEADHEEEL